MLAISTAWNYKPDVNLNEMLSAIKEIGLDTIELGYQLTANRLEELIPLLDEMKMKVVSLHNFCPIPSDEPSPRHVANFYRLSGLDEKERQRAVKWTKETINTACRVHAEAVVIHVGTIELDNDPCPRLIKMCKQGKQRTTEFIQMREEFLKARQEKRGPFLKNVIKSLEEVMPYAESKRIKIGLETRCYPTEIPNCEEIGKLLSLFHGQGLYYWHDTGHAEVNERLGIASQMDYLKPYQDQLLGFHIHGARGLRDHLAPFDGDLDLERIVPFMNAHHIKVIESHSGATPQQIKDAVKRLEK